MSSRRTPHRTSVPAREAHRAPLIIPLQDALCAALARVEDPELRRPITELGMVETALVHPELDDTVSQSRSRHWAQVTVLLTIEGCPLKNTIDAAGARRRRRRRAASSACSLSWVP